MDYGGARQQILREAKTGDAKVEGFMSKWQSVLILI